MRRLPSLARSSATLGLLLALAACGGDEPAPEGSPAGRPMPTVRLEARWPETGVLAVERELAAPIESLLAPVPGAVSTRSTSWRGRTVVDVRFSPEVSPRDALERVREHVTGGRPSLPSGAELRGPRLADLRERLVVIVGDEDPDRNGLRAGELIERLPREPGVAGLEAIGVAREELEIALDADRLRAYGLDVGGVLRAVEAALADRPAAGVDALGEVVLSTGSAGAIRLEDVAGISTERVERDRAMFDGRGAVVLKLRLSPDEDGPDVVALLRRLPPRPGVEVVVRDSATEGLDEVELGLPDGAASVVSERDLRQLTTGRLAGALAWTEEGGRIRLRSPAGSIEPGAPGIAGLEVVGFVPADPRRRPIELQLEGHDLAALETTAHEVDRRLAAVEGIAAVAVDGPGRVPRVEIVPDPERLAALGITEEGVRDVVRLVRSPEGVVVGASGGRPVRVRLREPHSRYLEEIGSVAVATPGGAFVPLSAVARIRLTTGPSRIVRRDGRRTIRLTAFPAPGVSRETVLREARRALEELEGPEDVDLRLPE